ncbi:VWA-like domain-containing protein [uncultured Eubacterium sp.]|uniref:vWA domain-containing protein n=1 Tax=uncultured Eubacterium sp. TaxID=165185 RepID=UPI0025CC9D3D|nr:VWA-like domain-containing protein [uncultured Eubacterium sp.]
MEQEKQKTEEELAAKIMEYARDELMISMRFLDRALFRMPLVAADSVAAFGVDGATMYYNPGYVLHAFKKEKNACTRAFLHMILHCIFSHPFQYEKMDRECWDLATDLAVEQSILDLNLKCVELERDASLKRTLLHLEQKVPILTAEKIYRWLYENPEESAEFFQEEPQFMWDDHLKWIPLKENEAGERRNDSITTDTRTAMVGCHEADTGEEGEQEDIDEALVGQRQGDWQDVSQHAKTDLEMFSHEQGYGAGSLLLNLNAALREKYDYGEFLRKFAVLGEEMHVNDDEFDYIYYTYGLQMYKNMPLVEPLEYRENKRIREFVIAIDTSGSCQGKTVERFLRKTYNILKSSESYFERVNIHIIQCDEKIQRDVKVTTDEEFEKYMEDVELCGFGGTDFRPVFEYVDGLIRRHEFQDLKGLIYFTDGQGTFPERMPDYQTAFVFVQEGYSIPEVPIWAIRLVLDADDV